ncbi:MAG: hypothetical protein KDE14_06220 [Rhodobacteraceae bacterium]|nr:hypothetical protein [Paracoccaceae bacterium]
MPISPLYEIYEIRNGQWSLVERFTSISDTSARDRAVAHYELTKSPCLLIEESDDSDGDTIFRITWSSVGTSGKVRPPGGDADLTSRFAMIGMAGIAAGAIGAILVSSVMSATRGSASGLAAILAFLGCAVGGMLVMFRIAVPTEIILWRNKPAATREKIIELLTLGSLASESETQPAARPGPSSRASARRNAADPTADSDANAEESATIFGDGEHASSGNDSITNIEELIAASTATLTAFGDTALQSVQGGLPSLSARERTGLQIFFAGAALDLAGRDALTPQTTQEILATVLMHMGCDQEAAISFAQNLDSYAYQTEYAQTLAAGRSAMDAHLQGLAATENAALMSALQTWTHSASPAATKFVVLLASSIAGTQIANPQRARRTHDSMVRIALKIGRGSEIRSDDNGFVAAFSDAISAVAAATEIQQSAAAFARDNPDANFAVRIAVGAGDVTVSGETYGGEALKTAETLRASTSAGEIRCSEWVRAKTAGTIYRYAAAGNGTNAGETASPVFKLLWEPKRVYATGPIEYRNIGAKPKRGEDN